MLGKELAGLTVVSIEQAVAAPYCGLLLADAGARVIKVERPGGDFARSYDGVANGNSAYFIWLNRGKESIVIDLDADPDRALLLRMLRNADVFLHNLAPGALERRGLTGRELRRSNPRLITCEISGYGREGPYASMKAYDLLVQAEAGLCSVTGSSDAPARVGISLCDLATGLTAFSAAILRGLLARASSGTGVDLQVAMFDVLADWMNVPLIYQLSKGRPPARMGMAHATLAPYGLYRTADGKDLIIAVQSNREWRIFCSEVLDMPRLGEDPLFSTNERRVENRERMDAHIARVFEQKTAEELGALLQSKQIAFARMNTVADLASHPHLRSATANISGHDVRLADLPIRSDGARPRHVPGLDEHGNLIRREFAPIAEDRHASLA